MKIIPYGSNSFVVNDYELKAERVFLEVTVERTSTGLEVIFVPKYQNMEFSNIKCGYAKNKLEIREFRAVIPSSRSMERLQQMVEDASSIVGDSRLIEIIDEMVPTQ